MSAVADTLFRLIYASSIKQEYLRQEQKTNVINQDILEKARINNPRMDIDGVLFYGDGYFFQCLEGHQHNIEKLFDKICLDDRHENIAVLQVSHINKRYFAEWSMKFVEDDMAVKRHLEDLGQKFFNPYLFDANTTSSLIKLFIKIN